MEIIIKIKHNAFKKLVWGKKSNYHQILTGHLFSKFCHKLYYQIPQVTLRNGVGKAGTFGKTISPNGVKNAVSVSKLPPIFLKRMSTYLLIRTVRTKKVARI